MSDNLEDAFEQAMELVKIARENMTEVSEQYRALQSISNQLVEGLLGAVDYYKDDKVDGKVILELIQIWIDENRKVLGKE